MGKDFILGTAGHIDHGKTALIKALTGVDCDRLPEEKKRGITIDIGFAHLQLGDYSLGVVDVPGHERFIRNMLAGATGIDLALLVVSAGESIKPQTREHLEILRLLDVRRGIIAMTKVDLVDETVRDVVEMEIRDLVKGTFLETASIIRTSVASGIGIEELKKSLIDLCSTMSENRGAAPFRLAIDRTFVVQGHGTVVTGSVVSGQLRAGDAVEWLPSGGTVRVRSLQHHDHPAEMVSRGQRAAINLAGVAHEEVHRGQELARPGYLVPSRVLTVRLRVLKDARPIRHRTEVRLHLGTAETMASLSLLDADAIDPGGWGIAQLFLENQATAVWGQPIVLRDSSAEITLGGGIVLQPIPGKIRRRHIEMLERIERLQSDDPAIRAEVVAWFAEWNGFTAIDLARGAGIHGVDAENLIADLLQRRRLLAIVAEGKTIPVHAERLAELDQRILDVLGRFHQDAPLLTSHDRRKVLSALDYVGNESLLQGVVDRLITAKHIVGDLRRIARADFKPKLSANQRKLKDKIVEAHRVAGFQPPEPASFANQAGGNAAALNDIYEVAVAEGLLVSIDHAIFLHADVEAEMRTKIGMKLNEQPAGLTVAEIRDLLGTTRKFAIPLCEYLDRVGVTKREGDLRVLGE